MGSGNSVATPARHERSRPPKRGPVPVSSTASSSSTQGQTPGLSPTLRSHTPPVPLSVQANSATPPVAAATQRARKGSVTHTPTTAEAGRRLSPLVPPGATRAQNPLADSCTTSGPAQAANDASARAPSSSRGSSASGGPRLDNPLSLEAESVNVPDTRAATLEGIHSLRSLNSDEEFDAPSAGRALLPEPRTLAMMEHRRITNEAAHLVMLRARIRPTWRRAAEMGNIPVIGAEVYHHMLTVNPNLASFFGGIFIADQGIALMEMIGSTVDPDNVKTPQDSIDQLVSAGVRHRGYGVTESTLPALKDAFLDVFPHFTDRAMYQETAADWQDFFDLVIATLQRGASSPEGDRFGRLYMKQMTQILAKDWHLIEDRQDRDTNHKFITFMCQKGFLLKPSLMSFDALLDVRVGKRIFDSITAIVDHLDEMDLVEEYLVGMGVNHDTWRISYSDFVLFTNPFLETCEYYLSDMWTIAMEVRLARLFQFLIDGMARGMIASAAQSAAASARP